MVGWDLILDLILSRHSVSLWTPPKLSFGMDLWACLSLISLLRVLRYDININRKNLILQIVIEQVDDDEIFCNCRQLQRSWLSSVGMV